MHIACLETKNTTTFGTIPSNVFFSLNVDILTM